MKNNLPIRVALVGAGRVGLTLAHLLKMAGSTIETIITSNPKKSFESLAPKFIPQEYELIATPDLLIVATPDDAIESVALKLAGRADWRGTIALHCSGALDASVLSSLSEVGATIGSLHPLKSFAQPITDNLREALKDVYWCVEGEPRAKELATKIVQAAQGNLIMIKAEDKPLYHAAAVMACGHLVALIDISMEMLQDCGINRRNALKMLLPLVESTVENLDNGPENAITGPFARQDFQTIKLHFQNLITRKADYATLYSLLGHHSLELIKRKRSSTK